MKLRLRGNSIRLRLSQTEVAQLAGEGRVEEFVEFGNDNSRFRYSVRASAGSAVTATFDGGEICVCVPGDTLRKWAGSDEVTIGSDGPAPLRILIEKDFACLSARPGENESDMFPNPAAVSC
jgi:hypothetical protein